MPDGICVIRHEVFTLFRFCPPHPVPLYHSIFSSESATPTLTTDGSITATVTVEVWTLPLRSVGGTRCMRWPPGSLNKPDKSLPSTAMCISPSRAETRRVVQPTLPAIF